MDDALLTLDIDWAPDCTIEWIARTLVARQVRAPRFVTHLSPAVERLRDHPDLFQLGIHPNFLAGSSHGDTTDAVLGHCMGLVPEALTMRSHALVQSPPILGRVMSQTPVVTDLSLYLPYTAHLRPVEYRVGGRALCCACRTSGRTMTRCSSRSPSGDSTRCSRSARGSRSSTSTPSTST